MRFPDSCTVFIECQRPRSPVGGGGVLTFEDIVSHVKPIYMQCLAFNAKMNHTLTVYFRLMMVTSLKTEKTKHAISSFSYSCRQPF